MLIPDGRRRDNLVFVDYKLRKPLQGRPTRPIASVH
jgi:hypothetical protein